MFLVGLILLACFAHNYSITNSFGSAHCTFFAKQATDDGNYVYYEVEGGAHLLRLRCPDQQMYDAIVADTRHKYHIEYRWNQKTYQGTLELCEANTQDSSSLGGQWT